MQCKEKIEKKINKTFLSRPSKKCNHAAITNDVVANNKSKRSNAPKHTQSIKKATTKDKKNALNMQAQAQTQMCSSSGE